MTAVVASSTFSSTGAPTASRCSMPSYRPSPLSRTSSAATRDRGPMAKEPWRSISLPLADRPPQRLSLDQAKESPCATCSGAPCCTYLPLHHFRIDNISQLDHAMYVLNFDRIELGLTASGDWGVYYRYPCRFLDRERYLCRLHDTPEQPRICVHYNPYSCWYKKHLAYPSDDFLRIDRRRMAFIASRVQFDEH